MRRLSSTAGFTLIEIMVVVFILGLLVTLVAPKILGKTDQARQVKARADIKAIKMRCTCSSWTTGSIRPQRKASKRW
jgi:type II secretion system protein G